MNVDNDSKPGSWGAVLSIKWIKDAYHVEDWKLVKDFDTAEGSHVHTEETGEYEAITEWCDEPPKGS